MSLFDFDANDTTQITTQVTGIGDLVFIAGENGSVEINGNIGLTGDTAREFSFQIGNTISELIGAFRMPGAGSPSPALRPTSGLPPSRQSSGFLGDPKQLMIVGLIGAGLLFAMRRNN